METLTMQLDRRGLFTFLYLCLVLVLLAGCTVPMNINKTYLQPETAIPPSRKVTVAVLPFETVEQSTDSDSRSKSKKESKSYDEKWREFESKYFPARLAQTLSRSPWVKEAYVSPIITPSVDFLVKGGIIESNGQITEVSITLTRCCWKDVHTETFNVTLASSHFQEMTDPGAQLWIDPVNKIGSLLDKVTPEELKAIEHERALAYLGDAAKRVDLTARPAFVGKQVQMLSSAEREKLLGFVTQTTFGNAEKAMPSYIRWQKDNTKHWEEKRREDINTAVHSTIAVLSFAGGIASARLGGPTGLYASSLGTSVGLAMSSAQASSKAMKEIENATAAFGAEMAPRTIELNGEVLTLTGRSDEQMATFKQIARTQLLKTLER